MRIISSPLQGYTDSAWRVAHAVIFGGVDNYVAPFVRVERGEVRRRELLDINPERNPGIDLTPQILAAPPAEVEMMLSAVNELGYRHVSVNLGCPHPPLTRRHRGAGMLPFPDEVEQLFTTLAGHPEMTYSVKMRLGLDNELQWRAIMPLLPIINPTDVTIHFRTATQQYRGEALREMLPEVAGEIRYPLIYNGDVTTVDEIRQITEAVPSLSGVMIGRGLVANPAMIAPERATAENYRDFHYRLYDAYSQRLTGGDHQLLTKLQSLWEYLLPNADRRARKAIRKATNLDKYHHAIENLFDTL